ncbi:MAG TPA: amino acid permease [Sandaracinaceae bacterium LLY-WYZ-13_1]|nr:amino acid permease [Sandaracinaceae bacterium LLY-WYZ-13_1]
MSSAPPHRRLRRELGLVDVFAISTGAMFSSGFFLLPGLAFARAGVWMVLAYALSAVLVVPAMLSAAELASALPRAGGAYYFLDRSMGPLVGTVGGLGTWIAMGLKNTFALVGIGAYLTLFVDLDIRVVAIALAVLFTAINVVGARETARLQRWLVYALVGILALFLVAGLVFVSRLGLVETTSARFAAAPATDLDGVLATVGLVFVSYAGLTKVAGVAEEVERPDRNILRGMVLSLLTAVTVYVLGTYLIVLVVPAETLVTDLAPVATAARTVFDWTPAHLGVALVVVAAVAAFASTTNAGIMSASRYLLAMGRDRLIGSGWARVGRLRTPTRAVLATGSFIVLALLTLDVVSIAKLASAFQLLMFAFLNLAVIVMRESQIATYDPAVRTPLYPWTQLLGVFLSLALIVEMGRMPMLFTLGLVAVGVGWFFLYGKRRVVRQGAILHWFERLGRDRFDALEDELWTILKETGLRADDPYDALVESARIVEIDERISFAQAAQRAAEKLAPRVAMEAPRIAERFDHSVEVGLPPVSGGVAMAHFRAPGLRTHELVLMRASPGVRIDSEDAEALFFLVSPDEDPGQQLRLLAKLCSQAEQPDFLTSWRSSAAHSELRELLTDDRLSRLARRLTRKLRSGTGRAWRPRTEPGRFESVLVVHPQGVVHPEVVSFVEELAKANHARMTLAEPDDRTPRASRSPEAVEAAGRSARAGALEPVARRLRDEGVDARSLVLSGRSWLAVVREVLREEHDLLVVESASPARGFGSDVQHLLRKCPCPVWVVRPDRGLRPARVLVALDTTATDDAHRTLNTEILGFAATVTEQTGAELHIVHAWHEVPEEQPQDVGVAATVADGGAPDWHADYDRRLHVLLRPHHFDRQRTHIHLIEGEPSKVIPEVAEAQDVDLIIMGTVCRTGVSGFLIGNTAENVLQRVDRAVLAVKPRGFVTPVDGG